MAPYLAQAVGTPRIVGVEFPFGHPLGHAGDREEQLQVIRDALRALVEIKEPNTVVDLPYVWPDFEYWSKAWHPPEPAPITKYPARAGTPACGSEASRGRAVLTEATLPWNS